MDPGHHYELDVFDGHTDVSLRFMKRIGKGFPGNVAPSYAGTNCQEVIRALIDRVKYLHGQIPHEQNGVIVDALRTALLAFEIRAAERHGRDFVPSVTIEHEPTCRQCGHCGCEHLPKGDAV